MHRKRSWALCALALLLLLTPLARAEADEDAPLVYMLMDEAGREIVYVQCAIEAGVRVDIYIDGGLFSRAESRLLPPVTEGQLLSAQVTNYYYDVKPGERSPEPLVTGHDALTCTTYHLPVSEIRLTDELRAMAQHAVMDEAQRRQALSILSTPAPTAGQ